MLKRAENVTVSHKSGVFSSKGPVTLSIGSKSYVIWAKVPHVIYELMLNDTMNHPVCLGTVAERSYWLFHNRWHWDNERLSADQVYALLVTREQRSSAQVARAQTMVAMQLAPTPTVRGAIPADVKQLIWTRDGGRCRQCGTNTELQYDHIIPVAYGGSSAVDNLQILCGPCNRRKGASI